MDKIFVVHPDTQHSAELVAALKPAYDTKLITRLSFGSHPRFPWNARVLRRRMHRRYFADISDDSIIRVNTVGALLEKLNREGHGRCGRLDLISTLHRRNSFQERASRKVRSALAVVGFRNEASELFSRVRDAAPATRLILDMSHPPDAYVQREVRADAEANGLEPSSYDDYRIESELAPIQLSELESADHVLVGSTYTADLIRKLGVDGAKISIVPYGTAPVSLSEATSELRDPTQLIFVGAFSERKGISLLLRAMEDLERRGSDLKLLLVGKESGGYRLPAELPKNVKVLHDPPTPTVRRLMRQSSLLVLPSMCEGFGRVLLEGLANGTPVMTTENSGGPDILAEHPGAPVYICPVDGRQELSTYIESTMAALPADVSVQAHACGQAYSFTNYSDHVIQVIRSVVGPQNS